MNKQTSDGSTASYYELPSNCRELQDLISHRDMNAQIGEIFRACYRYGRVEHSDRLRDARKIKFYAEAEIRRLEQLLVLACPKGPIPRQAETIEKDKQEQLAAADLHCATGVDHHCNMMSPREGIILDACKSTFRSKAGLIMYLESRGVNTFGLENDLCKLLHCKRLEVQGNKFITL